MCVLKQMEQSLSSLTYKGSIPAAIAEAKNQRKLFVVYISGLFFVLILFSFSFVYFKNYTKMVVAQLFYFILFSGEDPVINIYTYVKVNNLIY